MATCERSETLSEKVERLCEDLSQSLHHLACQPHLTKVDFYRIESLRHDVIAEVYQSLSISEERDRIFNLEDSIYASVLNS